MIRRKHPIVLIVNVNNDIRPAWRVTVDNVIVGRGTSCGELHAFHAEVAADDAKAIAIRDHFLGNDGDVYTKPRR